MNIHPTLSLHSLLSYIPWPPNPLGVGLIGYKPELWYKVNVREPPHDSFVLSTHFIPHELEFQQVVFVEIRSTSDNMDVGGYTTRIDNAKEQCQSWLKHVVAGVPLAGLDA